MFQRKFIAFLCFFLVLLASQPVVAQKQDVSFQELESVALAELKETNTPGMAIAIVSGERVIFAKGLGVSNLETGTPVTPDMVFRIGSTTKMYTAALLVTLAEEGKLKLDVPIGTYVKGLNPRLSQLTAHQLMSHTAGLRDEGPSYGPHDETNLATTVRSWTDEYLFWEPGKIFSYSNPGPVLAGYLVEQIGGKPYADQVTERILKPLGMNLTTFHPTQAMSYPLSQGHEGGVTTKPVVVRPFADHAGYWPSGFLFSNVFDLSRFAIAFMHDGKIEGKPALSPSVITKLSTGYVDVPSRLENARYGYGLFVRPYRGLKIVEHGGSIRGFGCLFQMVPEHQFAVIILANKSGVQMSKTAEKAMELVLPLQKKVEKTVQPLPITETDLSRCVGIYTNPPVRIEIVGKDGKLFWKQGERELPMMKTQENRFSIFPPGVSKPQEIVLFFGTDGKVEYLHTSLRAFKRVHNNQ